MVPKNCFLPCIYTYAHFSASVTQVYCRFFACFSIIVKTRLNS